MNKKDIESKAAQLDLIEKSRTRDGWPHSWDHPTEPDLVIWRLSSGQFQTAYFINDRFRDHHKCSTLDEAFARPTTQSSGDATS